MRRLWIYLAVTFGISWSLGLLLVFAVTPGTSDGSGRLISTTIALAYMFGPALGAIVAQRTSGKRVLRPLGVTFGINRWWLLAWLLPFALALLALAASLLFPSVSFSPDLSGFYERLATMLPPSEVDATRQELEAVSPAVFWALLVVQPLVAGVSINAIAAFGEELGWRGLLFREFEHVGFWRASLIIGVIWGVWHAPLILQGHNYPAHPVVGVFLMIAWTTLLAPVFQVVRIKSGSVIAAAILHGTINACAGIALLFVRGGSDLLVGITGLAGCGVLVVVNLALFALLRTGRLVLNAPPASAS